MGAFRTITYITSKVLLFAQDGFVSIKLDFKQSHELLHTLLIRHLPEVRLDNFLPGNA
jgi:hypothetical protein